MPRTGLRIGWSTFTLLLLAVSLPGEVTISGRVVARDPTTHTLKPVEAVNVTVSVSIPRSIWDSKSTDALGAFSFKVPDGTEIVTVLVYKTGFRGQPLEMPVRGQDTLIPDVVVEPVDPILLRKLVDAGFQLRKSFSGTSQDQSQAAEVGWAHDAEIGAKDFWNVNLAAKIVQWSPFTKKDQLDPPVLVVSPVVEWHHTSTGLTITNKLSFKLMGEYQPIVLRSSRAIVPVAVLSVQGNHDFVAGKWSDGETLIVTGLSTCTGCPGRPERLAKGALLVRYFPYGGITRAAGSSVPGQPAYLGVLRMDVQLDWLSRIDPTRQFLEMFVGYIYEPRITSASAFPGHVDLLTLSVATFLDPGNHFGVGLSYQRGEDPVDNFKFDSRSSIGLRVKF